MQKEILQKQITIPFESFTDPLIAIDLTWHFMYINSAAEQLLDLKQDELIGKCMWEVFPDSDGSILYKELHKAMTEQVVVRVEEFYPLHNTWYDINAFPFKIGLFLYFRDITDRKCIEEELNAEKNKFLSVINSIEDGLTIQDLEYNIIYQNEAIKKVFGGRLGEKCYSVYEGKNSICNGCPVEMVYKDGKTHISERKIVLPSGEIAYFENKASPIKDAGGNIISCVEIARNITNRRKAEAEMHLLQTIITKISVSKDLQEALLTTVKNICNFTGWVYGEIWKLNSEGTHLLPTKVFYSSIEKLEKFSVVSEGMTFQKGVGLPGRAWALKQPVWVCDITLDPGYLRAQFAAEMGLKMGVAFPVIADNEVVTVIIFYQTDAKEKDAQLVKIVSAVVTQLGPVIKSKQAEEIINRMAYYDTLTDMPNRILFNDRLTLALSHAHRTREMLAVLFLDLDRFKIINDTLGHALGDLLLKGIADRLKHLVRDDDTIGRLGGDEFILLLPGIVHADDVNLIARKIIEAFKQPWMIEGHEIYITTSIGIAFYPVDGKDTENLVKNADTAMYHAKELGRNNYQFYKPDMHIKYLEKITIEKKLRLALERKEFVVYYQPQVNINTKKIVGIEALVRWHHPEQGLLFPGHFISVAENNNLISSIDEWVLKTVCSQNKTWQDVGFRPLRIAVNLSAHTFHQQNLVEMITSVLQKTGLDPHFLELEITESIAMQNVDTIIDKLNKLCDLGIKIAIDDFGTGFSSLFYLKKFPVNRLKISDYFVRDMVCDQNDKIIVGLVIELAHSLKFRVVAEGVETKEQLVYLKERKCNEVQGNYFCKPLPAEEVEKMLVMNT